MNAITQAPCKMCPFRKDVPIYLRPERRQEIAESLINDQNFMCHGTVNYDVEWDEEPNTADAVICAGAAKSLMLSGGTTNLMRVAERLGLADLDRTEERGPDVWPLWEWPTLEEGSTGDDPVHISIETCSVCGPGCEAPAGFMGAGGGVIQGDVSADERCEECGEPVCGVCISIDGLCDWCTEPEEDD